MPHHIGFIIEETGSAAALETRLNELRLINREPFYFLGTTIAVLEETHYKFGESSDQLDLTNHYLTVTGRASMTGFDLAFTNLSKNSGKWYCELRYDNSVSEAMTFGVVGFGHEVSESYPGDTDDSYGFWAYDGKKYTDGVGSTYGSFVYTDDVLMMALDMDNGEIYWGSNGVWFDSGNPATRTNPAYTGLSGYKFVAVSLAEPLSKVTADFGPTFKYTAPAGFLPFQS
jgi:hypothetical protein